MADLEPSADPLAALPPPDEDGFWRVKNLPSAVLVRQQWHHLFWCVVGLMLLSLAGVAIETGTLSWLAYVLVPLGLFISLPRIWQMNAVRQELSRRTAELPGQDGA